MLSFTTDKWIRGSAAASVTTVAGIAAVISYNHIFHVAVTHGQSSLDARLLPLSVDGLICAASLTAFYASRNRLPVPSLARMMLGLGIAATIAVNLLYGLAYGLLGALLSAWPAIAFIGTVELVIWTVRAAASIRPVKRVTAKTNMRQWARFNGFEVSDRGRIPAEIEDAYISANGNGVKPADDIPAGSE